jgi:WD40 repeat protein
MSPDGAELAVTNYDGILNVVNVSTGRLRLNVKAWPDFGISICWSPDGRMIASGEAAKAQVRNPVTGIIETPYDPSAIKIWSALTGVLISELKATLPEGSIRYLQFSPDSAFLISNQRDGFLRVWRAADMKLVQTVSTDGRADFMSFSPSGQYLAVTRRDSVLIFAWPKS